MRSYRDKDEGPIKVVITQPTFIRGHYVEPDPDGKPIEVEKVDGDRLILCRKAVQDKSKAGDSFQTSQKAKKGAAKKA